MLAHCFAILITGTSMEPVLHDGHFYTACPADTVHAGDVVVFRGLRPDEVLVKRATGVPGDSLGWRFGREVPAREQRPTIPEGHYYVKSDKYNSRYDSRAFGLIERSRIIGTVELRHRKSNCK